MSVRKTSVVDEKKMLILAVESSWKPGWKSANETIQDI